MTFDEWFKSKQGEAFDSMYDFAKAAWHARSDQLADLERYRHALHEVVFACRTKISMKQKAREALFNEQTAHIPD